MFVCRPPTLGILFMKCTQLLVTAHRNFFRRLQYKMKNKSFWKVDYQYAILAQTRGHTPRQRNIPWHSSHGLFSERHSWRNLWRCYCGTSLSPFHKDPSVVCSVPDQLMSVQAAHFSLGGRLHEKACCALLKDISLK